MKFYIKNTKIIVEVEANQIEKLQRIGFLGEPVKEKEIEKAILKPVEKQVIR